MQGKIADVTKFIDDHPGGEDVIRRYVGEDMTKAYTKVKKKGSSPPPLPSSFSFHRLSALWGGLK